MSAICEAGFEVSAVQMFHMEKANAEEFFEVYKGVVAEYKVNKLGYSQISFPSQLCPFEVKWNNPQDGRNCVSTLRNSILVNVCPNTTGVYSVTFCRITTPLSSM